MEGKVYYKIKTPNGFLDTHYETFKEAQKYLEEYKKENGEKTPLFMTKVTKFEEELLSFGPNDNDYDIPNLQLANVTQKEYEDLKARQSHFFESYTECEEERERLENSIEDNSILYSDLQVNYGDLAKYTISLEDRKLWDIIKAKIFGDKKPDNYEHLKLDSYKYNPTT